MIDAGPDAGPNPCKDFDAGHDDSGVRCMCQSEFSDGMWYFEKCCDPDIGNPCPVCCDNPREADGGRQYYPDGGPPVCYC